MISIVTVNQWFSEIVKFLRFSWGERKSSIRPCRAIHSIPIGSCAEPEDSKLIQTVSTRFISSKHTEQNSSGEIIPKTLFFFRKVSGIIILNGLWCGCRSCYDQRNNDLRKKGSNAKNCPTGTFFLTIVS